MDKLNFMGGEESQGDGKTESPEDALLIQENAVTEIGIFQ